MSFLPPEQTDDFVDVSDVIRDTRFHRWHHAERLMHPSQVVYEV
jgi:hypothetical protein